MSAVPGYTISGFDIPALAGRAIRERSRMTAVRCDGEARTFAEVGDRAGRLASALRERSLETGDRVAVLLNNRIEYPEVDLGIVSGDLVRVALNARLGLEDLSFVIEDSGARVLLSEPLFDDIAAELTARHELTWVRLTDAGPAPSLGYEDLLATARPTVLEAGSDPERTAWLSYTSGTTGRPKGVVISHRALVQVAFNIMLELGPVSVGRSILLPQPLSHGAGFFVLPYLAAGGTVHIMPRFDPELALRLGREHRIDTLKLVPTMLADLMEVGADSAFETIAYGAAPITRPQLERALDRFGPVLVQIYGQSEAPVTISVLHKADHARPGEHRSSAGRPWRSVDVAVLDPDGQPVADGEMGELAVRGNHLMTHYHRRPEETAQVLRDGWLWTRDLAVRDEEGYLHLRGRRDDMINSGGFNIAPVEVEEVVAQHPAVANCAVVGVPHERWGETVQVHVSLHDGQELDPAELIEHCRPLLGFRRPRSVVLVKELPRTPYGKIDRSLLDRDASDAFWDVHGGTS